MEESEPTCLRGRLCGSPAQLTSLPKRGHALPPAASLLQSLRGIASKYPGLRHEGALGRGHGSLPELLNVSVADPLEVGLGVYQLKFMPFLSLYINIHDLWFIHIKQGFLSIT